MTDESANKEQTFTVLAQYIKDLSFENLHPLSKLASEDAKSPQIDVQMHINVEDDARPDVYTVSMKIEIKAEMNNKKVFLLDIKYAGDFMVKGFAKELLAPMLYVECPRYMFPFARSIIANVVSEGGCPPLYLAPVNFAELYQQQQQQQANSEKTAQ